MRMASRALPHWCRRRAGLAVLAAALIHPLATGAQQTPAVLERAVGAGVKVVRQFPAGSGLAGWVLVQGARHSVVYTTADGKTLLAGALVDERGRNLTARHEDMYVPKPDFSAAYRQLEKSAFVTEGAVGRPKSVIHVFVDPNCPYCHAMWRALQPYEAAGLQVRWIPVATLGPTSMPKAVAVLAAPDKTAAFRRMEQGHGQPWTPDPARTERTHPEVAAGKVQVKSGMPRLSELPSVTGLPEQRVNDSALARFK